MASDFIFIGIFSLLILNNYLNGQPLFLSSLPLALYLSAMFSREWLNRQRTDFINQLKSQGRELRNGGTVSVDNMLLRYNTELTSYAVSIGILFTSVNLRSAFEKKQEGIHPKAYLFTLITLLTGWWSLSGPTNTISVLVENLRGGERREVAELIDAPLYREAEEALT